MTKGAKATKSALIIIIFTLGSKFLGFIREVLIATKFGSGFETDTYVVAMTAIGLISGLLGPAITTTIIPILSEIGGKKDRKSKIKETNNILNTVFLIALAILAIGYAITSIIIKITAKGFIGEQFDLAVLLTRIGLPTIIFTGIMSVLVGYLHSEQRFTSAASVGFAFNSVYIVFLLFFASTYRIKGLIIAGVIATMANIIILLPDLIKSKYRYAIYIDFKDKYLKKALMLAIPIYLGTIMDQINIIIDRTLASTLQTGSISALNYANKLNGLILGIFVSAISTVIFPMLSNAFNEDNLRSMKEIMNYGIRLIIIITVPSLVGLVVLAAPIVEIAFERGAFNATATIMTSQALIFYSMGLVAMGIGTIVTRVYYSLQDTKTPMIGVVISLSINIILNLIFIKFMGHMGLALATSIASSITTIFMLYRLKGKIGALGTKGYIICFIKTGLSAGVMGIAAHFAYYGILVLLGDAKVYKFIALVFATVVGALLYVMLSYFLKVEEIRLTLKKMKERLL